VAGLRSTFAALVAVVTVMTTFAPAASAADTTAEAESLTISPASAGRVLADAKASGGKSVQLRNNGSVSVSGTFPASTSITVVARAQYCWGYPSMTIKVDGQPVYTASVKFKAWTPYTANTTIPAGEHTVEVAFTNDFNLFLLCDRALFVDKVAVVGGTSAPPVSAACAEPPPSSAQPFFDDFDGPAGTKPNPAMWDYQLGQGYLEVNTNYERNASLDGTGNLTINALKERIYVPYYGWYDYTSARLHTLGKWEMCYGTLRARIKIPNGKGIRPSFYLMGTDVMQVGWPAAGELDIIDAADTLAGSGIHGTGFRTATKAPIEVTGDWHELWLRWERDRIVTGVDDYEIATYTPASLPSGAKWPFNDRPMFIIINVSVGGASQGGPPNSSTQFPSTMLVDWIRYTPPG